MKTIMDLADAYADAKMYRTTHPEERAELLAAVEAQSEAAKANHAWLTKANIDHVLARVDLRQQIESLQAKLSEIEKQKPVAYEFRMRADWVKDWGLWTPCNKEQHEMYIRAPKLHDWIYETRALYAQPVAQPAPQQEQKHEYIVELPDGDVRETKVWWSERKATGDGISHKLCISVSETPSTIAIPEAQPVALSQYGSPELQSMILAKLVQPVAQPAEALLTPEDQDRAASEQDKYPSQQPAEPLTDEQKRILFECVEPVKDGNELDYYLLGIEAAELAHGIQAQEPKP
jgi:hypothetical protein